MTVLGLCFCARAFSSSGKWGPLFIAVRGLLTIAASLVAEHRLQMRRLSNCGSRAQWLHGMWDLPRPGLEPVSPALAGRLSPTAPPGKSQLSILYILVYICQSQSRNSSHHHNHTTPPWLSAFGVHMFVLYICVSVSALQTGQSVPFFQVPHICVNIQYLWASLVAQWLRICLPMQGTRVRALVWEDPTCHGATRPVSHNY